MIYSNISILRNDIYNADIGFGKHNDELAKYALDKGYSSKAEDLWTESKSNYQEALEIGKREKLELDRESIENQIKNIDLQLHKLEIEKMCSKADEVFKQAQKLQSSDLTEALQKVQRTILTYSEAIKMVGEDPEYQGLKQKIQTAVEKVRDYQSELQEKMDDLIGISAATTKVILTDSDSKSRGKSILPEKTKDALNIVREYEFIGGQVRFKVGLANNTKMALTNFKITFDIPDALKWILHEPKYERKGDSILIPKLGVGEKKAVSLYFEPINCMNSPINATVTFFDAKDRPQAVPMEPEMIAISCPMFFTESEANLARVKQLQRSLPHQDKKAFPIVNPEKLPAIFNSIVTVLGEYDIKLVSKDFSDQDKYGEIWYYGVTKVKKNNFVINFVADGAKKVLDFVVSSTSEEQITAFLAEVGNKVRQRLIEEHLISKDDKFYDINVSMLSSECPYCGDSIDDASVEAYLRGETVKCRYCDENIRK